MARFLELVKSPCFPVVVSLFVQTTLCIGTVKSIGICLDAISTSFNTTSTDIGVALGLYNMSANLPSPIVAFMYHRCRNVRIPLVIGSTLISSGLMLISFAGNNTHLTVCLFLTGMGHGILFTLLALILHDLADNNFNILLSLSMTGYGVAMVLPPLLAQILLTAYGWRGAMLILGALAFHILPCTLLVRTPMRVDHPALDGDRRPCLNEANERSCLEHGSDTEGFEREPQRCSRAQIHSRPSTPHMQRGRPDQLALGENNQPLLSEASNNENSKRNEIVSKNEHKDDENATFSDSGILSGKDLQRRLGEFLPSPPNHHQEVASTLLLLSDLSRDQERDDRPVQETNRYENTWTSLDRISRIIKESYFFTDPWGNFYFLVTFGVGFVYAGWHAFLIPDALQRGISPYRVLVITSAAAVGNIISRIGTGLITHSLILPSSLHLALCLVSAIAQLAYVHLRSFYAMVLMSFISAVGVAGRATLFPLVPKERSQPRFYSTVFSTALAANGLGGLLGGYISGMVADRFLTYDATFRLLAAMEVCNFMFMLPVRFVKKPNQERAADTDE